MTVLELIQRSAEYLGQRGVESPRLQVELLLGHVLRVPRLQVYLQFDRVLTEAELAALRELVRRRGARVPLQHLVGTTSFCGWEIEVTGDVLIPRPETERLACAGVEWVNAAGAGRGEVRCLDFGTGSGCLAVALLKGCPGVALEVDALDVSEAALEVARRNVERLGLAGRVRWWHGDGFAALPAGRRYGLIVSNPPYIPSGEIEGLSPEVRDHDPRLALDGGADGLEVYRRLASGGAGWLEPWGRMMLELGDGQEGAVTELFGAHKWVVERVERDYSGTPRVWVGRV